MFAGMLTKEHPDIALSIKTRQAVRSVLNNLRDGIHELLMDGILEEAEGHKLEKVSKKYGKCHNVFFEPIRKPNGCPGL